MLAAASLGVIAGSWWMPRDLQGWPAYAGPGVVTGLLAAGLLGMGVALAVRASWRRGAGLGTGRSEIRAYLADSQTWRLGLMVLLSIGYLLLLGRQIPYHLTTGGYLVLTMLLFRAAPWWAVLLISSGVTVAIALVFNRVFLIPLP